MDIMKTSETLDELFKIYLSVHYDAVLMKHNFDLELRRIVNTEVVKLKDSS